MNILTYKNPWTGKVESNEHEPEDCTHCRFLGHYEGCDLYIHLPAFKSSSSLIELSVIARYGPDGDYYSGLSFAVMDDPNQHLRQALIRALVVINLPIGLIINNTIMDKMIATNVPSYRVLLENYFLKYHKDFPERIRKFKELCVSVDQRMTMCSLGIDISEGGSNVSVMKIKQHDKNRDEEFIKKIKEARDPVKILEIVYDALDRGYFSDSYYFWLKDVIKKQIKRILLHEILEPTKRLL